MASILALDVATRLGWAFGDPATDSPVIYGVRPLLRPAGDGPGATLAALMDALGDMCHLHDPDWIVMEAPLHLQGHARQNSHASAAHSFYLAGAVHLFAYRWKIRLREVNVDHARSLILGRCRFGGRDQAKAEVMRWCRAAGYRPPDDNAGDALLLMHYGWQKFLGHSYRGAPVVALRA